MSRRREQTSKQTSEWPSTYVPILGCSAPLCEEDENDDDDDIVGDDDDERAEVLMEWASSRRAKERSF